MKEQPKKCKTCKHLVDLPFSGEYICANEESSYADCECDIENDFCEEWEDKEED